jgi:hypothetical protein
MSEARHTPKPWRYNPQAGAVVCDTQVGPVPLDPETREYYGGEVIAETVTPANGKLIERAPELLEALEEISHLWAQPPNCADIMDVSGVNDGKMRAIVADAAIKIARAALAKLKGEEATQ